MIIYKVTNKINNKVYIGQTTRTLAIRKTEHYKPSNKHCLYLHRALFYWPKEVFEWTVIYTANSIEELNDKEQYFITLFDSTNPEKGYNLTTGGLNFKMSEESKKKMSHYAQTKKVYTPTYINNLKISHTDNHKSYHYIYTLISPDNIKYENITNLYDFCLKHSLKHSGILGAFCQKQTKYLNWKIDRIKR
jgi:group I intron endonuclease